MAGATTRGGHVNLSVGVHPIRRASKANAWNVFVHEASDPEAQYLVLMDGDVRIEHPETLASLVRALERDHFASIAGARTLKHIAARRTWNPKHWISLGASEIRRGMPGTFAGCLYCARAKVLRQFRLPNVLIGEDVFVRAMIVTDFFTTPDRPARVITAPEATVRFEAYTSLAQVFKNLKRRAITLAIDGIIFERLWARSTPQRHGGRLLMQWELDDPGWDERLVRSEVRKPRWRRSPTIHLRKWIARLERMALMRSVVLFPAALVAGVFDGLAQYDANRALRRGAIGRGWFVKQAQPS